MAKDQDPEPRRQSRFPNIVMYGNLVNQVDEFTYLGDLQSADAIAQPTPNAASPCMASSVMSSLDNSNVQNRSLYVS